MDLKKVLRINRKNLEIVLPIVVVLVFGALFLSGGLNDFEYKVKDAFTWLVPEAKIDPKVVIVDVDDTAIQTVGMWPWSRDVHAGILFDLKALGATYITYDIEFVDRSPVGVTAAERDQTLAAKTTEMSELLAAYKGGLVKFDEVSNYSNLILSEGIMLTARDNDAQLGRMFKLFGKTFATINYDLNLASQGGQQIKDNPDASQAIKYAMEKYWLPGIEGDLEARSIHRIEDWRSMRGAIVPIASQSAGAGVTNVALDKDSDGVLRRITLLNRAADDGTGIVKIFGQLAFVPIWDWYGRPAIEVSDSRIVLKTSELAENPRPDIVIPLDSKGKMIINWPHRLYDSETNNFTHVYIYQVLRLREAGSFIHDFIDTLRRAGYLQANDFTAYWTQAQEARNAALASGDQADFDAYQEAEAAWWAAVEEFAEGSTETEILASLDADAAQPGLSAQRKAAIAEVRASVSPNFSELRKMWQEYHASRESLRASLKDAFCFMGWTSTTTTDFGVTPFDATYAMVGTHAAISNTIFNQAFLNESPSWVTFVVGVFLALALILVFRRFATAMASVIGFGFFGAFFIVVALVYIVGGTYIGFLVPGLTLLVTIVGLTVLRFFGAERDKAFLRSTFQNYVAPDVIEQIIADPSKLGLGGVKRYMTAMFTDVKGFSTFSENLDPQALVSLLNQYLNPMTNLILDTRGLIDKYEGDAIIANWGAFGDTPDHAARAMRTAILMKRAEAELNKVLLETGTVNTPLLTRIGINTGDMTVGNMGSDRRKDYTMMGNSVNLAARLEGVNKQYGTWILTSETTRNEAGDEFLVRRLDRVRVVGISTPVRLYEVVDIRAEAGIEKIERIEIFEEGLDHFENRHWAKAAKAFEEVLELDPNDGPSLRYLERCRKYSKEAPPANWDGVFNLNEK